MSPRPADPGTRSRLIEAAARLLIEHGPDALTTRRLAAEVGTSTMAVYTYFKGMEELRSTLAVEGFARLARFLDLVGTTDDPVADISALGGAYFLNGISNPDLYHFMFLERPDDDPECGKETYDRLVQGVDRALQAGRFSPAEAESLARQLWACAHGLVTLHNAGMLELAEAVETMQATALNLFIAFGDEPGAARFSLEMGRERFFSAAPQQSLTEIVTMPAVSQN